MKNQKDKLKEEREKYEFQELVRKIYLELVEKTGIAGGQGKLLLATHLAYKKYYNKPELSEVGITEDGKLSGDINPKEENI